MYRYYTWLGIWSIVARPEYDEDISLRMDTPCTAVNSRPDIGPAATWLAEPDPPVQRWLSLLLFLLVSEVPPAKIHQNRDFSADTSYPSHRHNIRAEHCRVRLFGMKNGVWWTRLWSTSNCWGKGTGSSIWYKSHNVNLLTMFKCIDITLCRKQNLLRRDLSSINFFLKLCCWVKLTFAELNGVYLN